ncbi:hypothetical protein Ct61P_13731 [Colletotrichum tofieldiae]|nr:hypothetical protein Ct61P_13731 [Colletotrichum tofieldiae]
MPSSPGVGEALYSFRVLGILDQDAIYHDWFPDNFRFEGLRLILLASITPGRNRRCWEIMDDMTALPSIPV